MTEDEARENFFKFQNQYKMANHEMKSLNNLKHVQPFQKCYTYFRRCGPPP